MIKLKYQNDHEQYYQFRPNHDRRKIFGKFELYTYKDRYEIWALGIIGDQRGKGYGTQMLKEFLQQFNHDKPLFLYVQKTNEIALRLYQKAGFVITRESYGGTAYQMQYMNCS